MSKYKYSETEQQINDVLKYHDEELKRTKALMPSQFVPLFFNLFISNITLGKNMLIHPLSLLISSYYWFYNFILLYRLI